MKTEPITPYPALAPLAIKAGRMFDHLDKLEDMPAYTRAAIVDGITVIVKKTPYKKRALVILPGLESGGLVGGGYQTSSTHDVTLTFDNVYDAACITTADTKQTHEDAKVTRLFLDPEVPMTVVDPDGQEPTSYIYRMTTRQSKEPVTKQEFDADFERYKKRLDISYWFPASLWSGKMRMAMQAKLGTKTFFDLSMEPAFDGSMVLKWAVHDPKVSSEQQKATLEVGQNIGLVGPFDDVYWLVTLSDGIVWACQLEVPLAGIVDKNAAAYIQRAQELAAFQSARPVKNSNGELWTFVCNWTPVGGPIHYDWKFNERGDEAAVVTVNSVYGLNTSALFVAQFSGVKATDKEPAKLKCAVTRKSSGVFAYPGGLHPCWIPSLIGMVLAFENHGASAPFGMSPIYCVYERDKLRVVQFATAPDIIDPLTTFAADANAFFDPYHTTPGSPGDVSATFRKTGKTSTQGFFIDGVPVWAATEREEYRSLSVAKLGPPTLGPWYTGALMTRADPPGTWAETLIWNYTGYTAYGYFGPDSCSCDRTRVVDARNVSTTLRTFCIVPTQDCNAVYVGKYTDRSTSSTKTTSWDAGAFLKQSVKMYSAVGILFWEGHSEWAWKLSDMMGNIVTGGSFPTHSVPSPVVENTTRSERRQTLQLVGAFDEKTFISDSGSIFFWGSADAVNPFVFAKASAIDHVVLSQIQSLDGGRRDPCIDYDNHSVRFIGEA